MCSRSPASRFISPEAYTKPGAPPRSGAPSIARLCAMGGMYAARTTPCLCLCCCQFFAVILSEARSAKSKDLRCLCRRPRSVFSPFLRDLRDSLLLFSKGQTGILVHMSDKPQISWRNKKVFLTGHTGFKGGWLALWLASKGAIVRGYALDPSTDSNLFTAARVGSRIGAISPENDIRGDIRDAPALDSAIQPFAPEVVFHLAAQPLVRLSYADPITTYRSEEHKS